MRVSRISQRAAQAAQAAQAKRFVCACQAGTLMPSWLAMVVKSDCGMWHSC